MRHAVSRILPYTPDQLFALVGDIEAYPQFVPWVSALRTWNHQTLCPGVDVLDAEVTVAFAIVRERFSTRVSRNRTARQIDVSLIAGPFRHLANRWGFTPEGAGETRVAFEIDFEFKSRLLAGLLTANMSAAVERLLTCFDDRARALYSSPVAPHLDLPQSGLIDGV